MSITICQSKASGKVIVPPSKSYAHRLLIAGALSKGISTISNVALSDDILATLNCLSNFKKKVSYNDFVVQIEEDLDQKLNDELVFNCNESGSTLRFLIPIALTLSKSCKFIGTKRLMERGFDAYFEICKKQNIAYEMNDTYIKFKGTLKADTFKVPGNISSQFITGLLFACPLLENDSIIEITTELESKNYIDITLDVLKTFGIKVDVFENKYFIKGNQKYISNNLTVEGDYSNAAFLDAFNFLNGNVELIGLKENSLQGDSVYKILFERLNNGYTTIDVSNCIDLGPILFCLASLKFGAKFINTKRLKIKESNRIKDLKEELNKFGVETIEFDNEVIINNSSLHAPTEILNGKNDHRIVMALSVMLSSFGGTIKGEEAVRKSYPNFFEDLRKINIEVRQND